MQNIDIYRRDLSNTDNFNNMTVEGRTQISI